MSQFYVETEADYRRCQEAVVSRQPITITGYVSNDSHRPYTGTVQSAQDMGPDKGRWRWFVTMRET